MNLHKSIILLDGVFGEIQGNHKMCCLDYLIQPNFFQLNPGVRVILFITRSQGGAKAEGNINDITRVDGI